MRKIQKMVIAFQESVTCTLYYCHVIPFLFPHQLIPRCIVYYSLANVTLMSFIHHHQIYSLTKVIMYINNIIVSSRHNKSPHKK